MDTIAPATLYTPHTALQPGTKCQISIGEGYGIEVRILSWSEFGITVKPLITADGKPRITFYPWHKVNAVSVTAFTAEDEAPE